MLACWDEFTENIKLVNCQLFVKCQKLKHLDYGGISGGKT